MFIRSAICGLVLICHVRTACCAQEAAAARSEDPVADKATAFPARLLGRLQGRTSRLNSELTKQSVRWLKKMQRREDRLQKEMGATNSAGARQLFGNSHQQYEALIQRLRTDTGSATAGFRGSYMPYIDSLQGMLKYLKAPGQAQALQARMGDADEAQAFVQQRKQEIGQYISQHADLKNLLNKPFAGLNQDVYYYSQQLREYREMWEHPDQLTQKALSILNKLPAFQQFMKNNSQLAGLFHIPGNYASPETLAGLQTKDQLAQQVQNQLSGSDGQAALQSNLQSAESQLDGYKDRLSKLGQGNGNMDLPNFKPNDQRTKPFWKRLEYGFNFQTTHNNYYFPTVTDFGLSLGYRLGHSNTIGVGASYKVGWGNGIQHIAVTNQGVGLRSFLEIRLKRTWSAAGAFEYNYTTPFASFQEIKQIERWTKSGLIGISKQVSAKGRFFKQTRLQLLWDFLSYQQLPKTQPILFRIAYTF